MPKSEVRKIASMGGKAHGKNRQTHDEEDDEVDDDDNNDGMSISILW